MIRIPILLAAAGLFLAACGDTSGVSGGRYYRSFVATRQDSAVTEQATADRGFRTIVVDGGFQAPTRCQDLSARIDDDNRDLTVTVTATARAGACPESSIGYFTYTMITGTYFPGAYRMRVIHTDSRGPRNMYDGNVIVTQ
jgi:hypothetical protein